MAGDDSLQPWGSVRWVGGVLSPTVSSDGLRLWRWTADDITRTGLNPGTSLEEHKAIMSRPPGTDEPGFALFRETEPLIALGRNPAGSPEGGYQQQILRWQQERWIPSWRLCEDNSSAVLVRADGTQVGEWKRRTRGRVRERDRFEMAVGSYSAAEFKAAGRWQSATGVEVSDDAGPVLRIYSPAPLSRDVGQVLRVETSRGVDPDLWAMTMGAFATAWDRQTVRSSL